MYRREEDGSIDIEYFMETTYDLMDDVDIIKCFDTKEEAINYAVENGEGLYINESTYIAGDNYRRYDEVRTVVWERG